MSTITKEFTKEQLMALISEAKEWAEIYEHPIHDKPQRDFFEGMARALTAYLAVLTAEPAKIMINRAKLQHILEYAKQQRHIGLHCKVPPEDMVEIVEAAMLQCAEQTNYRAIVERIAEIVHGKVTDIDLLTVTVKSMKDNLQGKASLRDEIRSEHAEWSQSTFGDVGPVGPLKHLSKEALEAAAEPEDLSEWADMQFLLWDAQRRAGITDEKITQALIDKLAVNKARQWPEPKDGEPRLHIKAGPKLEGQDKQKK